MNENLDKLIDINLKRIQEAESKNDWLSIYDFKDEKNNTLSNTERFAEILEEKGLIKIEPNKRQRTDSTEFGRQVMLEGGWLKHLEKEKVKQQKIEQDEIAERETLHNNAKLSGWRVKTFWIVLILSVGYNIYSFIPNTTSKVNEDSTGISEKYIDKQIENLEEKKINLIEAFDTYYTNNSIKKHIDKDEAFKFKNKFEEIYKYLETYSFTKSTDHDSLKIYLENLKELIKANLHIENKQKLYDQISVWTYIDNDETFWNNEYKKTLLLDLNMIENDILSFFYNIYSSGDFRFNKLNGVVFDSSSTIKVGEYYNANIILTAFDTINNYEVLIGEYTLDDNNFPIYDEDKMISLSGINGGVFKKKYTKPGTYNIKGIIKYTHRFQNGNVILPFPFDSKITVVE